MKIIYSKNESFVDLPCYPQQPIRPYGSQPVP
jgi:hypothetical protein